MGQFTSIYILLSERSLSISKQSQWIILLYISIFYKHNLYFLLYLVLYLGCHLELDNDNQPDFKVQVLKSTGSLW